MSSILRFCGPLSLRAISVKASQAFKVNPVNFKRFQSHDVNTNVLKDVMLFKYENPRFFKFMNIFGISQFCFWNYLAHFSYTTLRDAPVDKSVAEDENTAWFEKINLGDNKFRNSISIFCFLIGYGVLAISWMYTLRSVRFLVLRKGGREISFVTYTPFGKNRILNVPMNCISAQEARQAARSQLPLKVKNKNFFYILDMRGEFLNTKLFDYTAGLKRKLN
ncbi:TMEM223 family protein [Megaselia abdita]